MNTTMSLTNANPEEAARAAKISSRTLAVLSDDARNRALDAIYNALSAARDDILAANAIDLERAKKATSDGQLNPSIYKRLDLSRKGKFDDMLQGIRDVRSLPDPSRLPFPFPSLLSPLLHWNSFPYSLSVLSIIPTALGKHPC